MRGLLEGSVSSVPGYHYTDGAWCCDGTYTGFRIFGTVNDAVCKVFYTPEDFLYDYDSGLP